MSPCLNSAYSDLLEGFVPISFASMQGKRDGDCPPGRGVERNSLRDP